MPGIDRGNGDPGTVVTLVVAATSRREQAKNDRRRRIIDATCSLLREFGLDAVSGKLIAARAGVSLSTVYNLFGSKDAVLVAVYDEDLARFEAMIGALPSTDALARLFDAVDVAAALYEQDPAFYRAILWRRPPGELLDAALRRPRARFWETLVQQAVDDGQLHDGTDAGAVSVLLIHLFSGVLMDWVAGDIPLDRFRREASLGFTAILLAFVDGAARPALHDRMMRLHDDVRMHRADDTISARFA